MAKLLKVQENLNRIAEAREELAKLEAPWRELIAACEAEMAENIAVRDLREELAGLEADVKAQSLTSQKTFKGSTLQVVYYPATDKLIAGAIPQVKATLPELVKASGERAGIVNVGK